MILHIYLRYLFGEKKEDPKHKEFYANLRYMKKYINYNLFEKMPRYHLKTNSPVETFYKRNMNKNHPIPHIIVVGILRVLLSTCPNTKKNTTGGVHIHREWGSCLKLYMVNKDFFDEKGFKSEIFQHQSINAEILRQKAEKNKSTLQDELKELDGDKPEDGDDKSIEDTKKEDKKEEEAECLKDEDFFDLEDYKYENDRHRMIAAMIISDLFIYMLKHFKANCIN